MLTGQIECPLCRHTPSPELFLTTFLLVAGYLVVMTVALIRLRDKHSEEWIALGNPSIFFHGISRAGLRVFGRVLWRAEYWNLDDPLLTRFIWLARVLFLICIAMMVVTLLE